MMAELATFSVVLLLVMVGFATCFWAIYGNDSFSWLDSSQGNWLETEDGCDGSASSVTTEFGNFWDSVLTLFSAMLGDFDFSKFSLGDSSENECIYVPHREAGVILLVVYLIIMAVMLLNLLIAVLSTAHSKVYGNAEKQFHAARAKLIVQSRDDVVHDVLPPPFSLIKPISGLLWPSW